MTVTETRAPRPGIRRVESVPSSERPAGFRPDLDGLRAVAIVLVVLYHADVPGFAAGFIGVDIFFVISGFLIMTQLDRELSRTGTLRLPGFWARRARRLIPAATVTVIAVMVAGGLAYSPLRWHGLAVEGLATVFYVSNELFRAAATDYFAPALSASPLLNTWSLAVEEQFYIVWPLLLVLVARTIPTRGDGRRQRIGIVTVVSVVSFLFSLQMLEVDPAGAYLSALARAWEFGVGALLCLLIAHVRRLSPAASRAVVAAGFGALVWAMVTIDDRTAYPGWAAWLPVLAAASVIVGGAGRDQGLAATLGCRPMQAVGRISYSWYLWHWPVMVIGAHAIDVHGVPVATRVGLVLVALVPSLLTYRYLESVLRRAPSLVASNRRTAAVMAAFVVVAAATCGALWVRGSSAEADPVVQAALTARGDGPPLPSECATNVVAELEARCTWGDPGGSRTVLVLGDSHAAHWVPAFDVVGEQQGLRVLASMQGNCPAVGDGVVDQMQSCRTKRQGSASLIAELHPDLVVLADSVGYVGSLVGPDGSVAPADQQLPLWKAGVATLVDQLEALRIPVLIVLETPRFPGDVPDCLVTNRDPQRCDTTADEQEQILGGMHRVESEVVTEGGWGTVFDPNTLLCHAGTCPVTDDDGRLRYSDAHHLTTTESRSLAPAVADAVTQALAPPPTPR